MSLHPLKLEEHCNQFFQFSKSPILHSMINHIWCQYDLIPTNKILIPAHKVMISVLIFQQLGSCSHWCHWVLFGHHLLVVFDFLAVICFLWSLGSGGCWVLVVIGILQSSASCSHQLLWVICFLQCLGSFLWPLISFHHWAVLACSHQFLCSHGVPAVIGSWGHWVLAVIYFL